MSDTALLKARVQRLDERIVQILAERLAADRWLVEAEGEAWRRHSGDVEAVIARLAKIAHTQGLPVELLREVYATILGVGGADTHVSRTDAAQSTTHPLDGDGGPAASLDTIGPDDETADNRYDASLADMLPSAPVPEDDDNSPRRLLDRLSSI